MSRLSFDCEHDPAQEYRASVGEGLYMAALEKAATDAGMTPEQYLDDCTNADVDPLPLPKVPIEDIDF